MGKSFIDQNGYRRQTANPISMVGVFPYTGESIDYDGALGLEKKKRGLPVFDAVRERERLNTISGMVESDVLKPHMENIYRCIMDETKLVEEKLMEV